MSERNKSSKPNKTGRGRRTGAVVAGLALAATAGVVGVASGGESTGRGATKVSTSEQPAPETAIEKTGLDTNLVAEAQRIADQEAETKANEEAMWIAVQENLSTEDPIEAVPEQVLPGGRPNGPAEVGQGDSASVNNGDGTYSNVDPETGIVTNGPHQMPPGTPPEMP